eukprot:1159184-Pelagomonas_calceolata.AAC.8
MQQVPSEQQAARQAAVKDANPIAEVGPDTRSSVIVQPIAGGILSVGNIHSKLAARSKFLGFVSGAPKKKA